ncbi:hypothetical protein RHMOL_Rhmol13G0158900 [Rhododendron molle]|uniref:Uncharacterized protein n=1 Tax=Rhododendron molle TaxID=49168 RepID=A0ACC0L7R9_RHOML|nr:hypothetical protein RHMOL_Rhmol13G0158900 [Rhododendron molle]
MLLISCSPPVTEVFEPFRMTDILLSHSERRRPLNHTEVMNEKKHHDTPEFSMIVSSFPEAHNSASIHLVCISKTAA